MHISLSPPFGKHEAPASILSPTFPPLRHLEYTSIVTSFSHKHRTHPPHFPTYQWKIRPETAGDGGTPGDAESDEETQHPRATFQ
jgi:hypothetical protein